MENEKWRTNRREWNRALKRDIKKYPKGTIVTRTTVFPNRPAVISAKIPWEVRPEFQGLQAIREPQ